MAPFSHTTIVISRDCKILNSVVRVVLSGWFSKFEIVACLMPIRRARSLCVHWFFCRTSLIWFASWAGLAVLGSAACYALSAVLGRLLSRTDSSESLMLWIMVMLAVGSSVLVAPQWLPVRPQDYGLLAALAGTGFCAQLAITEAFRHGQASAVAPFEYTALAWGLGVDWLLWHTLPDGYTLLGGAIVVASGLCVVRHERVQASALHP